MAKVLDTGIDPFQIGFVSFTRAARAEAAGRAASQFGIQPGQLESNGWFRTLHSVCYRSLGVKDQNLLTGNAKSRKWIADAIGEEVSGLADERGLEQDFAEQQTEADKALRLWDSARARLLPLEPVWQAASRYDDSLPGWEHCQATIERYEQAKRLDGAWDFTDLLGRFAGKRFQLDGPMNARPDGAVPEVPVWFFDEQQDTSALLDAVCRRLIADARWVYVVGDPMQAIYGWAGADARFFMGWEVDKQEIMPKSYRCPAPVLALGEDILRDCSDYWDRGIAPADHEGAIEERNAENGFYDEIAPTDQWLLLARTNWLAGRMKARLNDLGLPWTPTRGHGGWDAPARNANIKTLLDLENGIYIDGDQWRRVVRALPARVDGAALLEHGLKARFERDADVNYRELYPRIGLGMGLRAAGATEVLETMLLRRTWRPHVEGAERYAEAVEQWGEEIVLSPRIRIGTIHSAKGMEADNVALMSSLTLPCVRSRETTEGNDEELRCWYVAVTRAKRRLVILRDRRDRHAMRLPL